jgi:hypothetical protein
MASTPPVHTSNLEHGIADEIVGLENLGGGAKKTVLTTSDVLAQRMMAEGPLKDRLEQVAASATRPNWKDPVLVATRADINLASLQSGAVIDSVTLVAEDRVFVGGQVASAANGIYRIRTDLPPVRSVDADTGPELAGLAVFVRAGAAHGGKQFGIVATGAITVGTTPLPVVEISDQVALNANIATKAPQTEVNDLTTEADLQASSRGFWPYQTAYTDAYGNVILAVNSETGFAEIVTNDLPGGPLLDPDHLWVYSSDGRSIQLGLRRDGGVTIGADPLLDPDFKMVERAANGRIARAQRWDGSIEESGFREPTFVYSRGEVGARNVFINVGGAERQLTFSGDNWAAEVRAGFVRYLSNQTGQVKPFAIEYSSVLPFDGAVIRVIHLAGLSQSLGVGVKTNPITTKPPAPTKLVSFNVGVLTLDSYHDDPAVVLPDASIHSLIPAVAKRMEPPIVQAGSRVVTSRGGTDGVLVSAHGVGATGIENLGPGSVAFSNYIKACKRASMLAAERGLAYLPILDWNQGEHDNIRPVGWYLPKLAALQAGATAQVNEATGHSGEVLLIGGQISSWTAYNRTFSGTALDQLSAALLHPTKIKCVGAKYHLPYYSDGIHQVATAAVIDGDYRGRVVTWELAGTPWLPMHVASVERDGADLLATFHTPQGALTLDTTLVSNPGNFGWNWQDNGDGNAVTIASVSAPVGNTVAIRLSAVPTGTGKLLGLADIGIAGALAGPTTGPRCNYRDSSPDLDRFGGRMFNWACHQQVSVS